MKVIDVEQVYLGYAVHWPTGIPAADQYTEIEMGAEESGRGGGEVGFGETEEGRWRGRTGGRVDEEVVQRGQQGEEG